MRGRCDDICKVAKQLVKEGAGSTFIWQKVEELRAAHEAEKVVARKARVEAARMAKEACPESDDEEPMLDRVARKSVLIKKKKRKRSKF